MSYGYIYEYQGIALNVLKYSVSFKKMTCRYLARNCLVKLKTSFVLFFPLSPRILVGKLKMVLLLPHGTTSFHADL